MPPRGPRLGDQSASGPAPVRGTGVPVVDYGAPAPRGSGMRGAVIGAGIGGVLAVGVVVYLSATIGTGAVVVAAVLALVPLAGRLRAIRWGGRWEPEPRAALWFAFAWGAGVAVVISLIVNTWAQLAFVQSGLDEVAALGMTAVVVAPLVE